MYTCMHVQNFMRTLLTHPDFLMRTGCNWVFKKNKHRINFLKIEYKNLLMLTLVCNGTKTINYQKKNKKD